MIALTVQDVASKIYRLPRRPPGLLTLDLAQMCGARRDRFVARAFRNRDIYPRQQFSFQVTREELRRLKRLAANVGPGGSRPVLVTLPCAILFIKSSHDLSERALAVARALTAILAAEAPAASPISTQAIPDNGETVRVFNFEGTELHGTLHPQHGWLFPTAEIARGYDMSESAIRKTKMRHPDELKEGVHYVMMPAPQGHSNGEGQFVPPPLMTMWTLRGGTRLGFWLTSPTSARFRDYLEDLAVGARTLALPAPAVPQSLPEGESRSVTPPHAETAALNIPSTVPAQRYIELQAEHIDLQRRHIAVLEGRR